MATGDLDNKNSLLNQWMARKNSQPIKKSILPIPEGAAALASFGQQRIWLLQKLHHNNPFYNYSHLYKFRGSLDIEKLKSSFQKIIQRHAILRTSFEEADGQVVQKVHLEMEIPFELTDIRHLGLDQRDKAVLKIASVEAEKPFDLLNGPLIRMKVLKLERDYHIVLLCLHHIVGDRWSLDILNNELQAFYMMQESAEVKELEPLDCQYIDFAHWQRSQPVKQSQLDYWLKKLEGELPVLKLPTDRKRPAFATFKGAQISKTYSLDLTNQLRRLSKKAETTLFNLILAAFKTLLYRYSGQTNILVGTPYSNRDQVALEKLIGFFNETLVIRSDLSDNPTFLDFVGLLKTTTLMAMSNKDVPFDLLVKELNPLRIGSENPLFQVMFLYNEAQPAFEYGPTLAVKEEPLETNISKFDLTLFIKDDGEQLSAAFEYSTDLFDALTIDRMHAHLENLLNAIVRKPNDRVSELIFITKEEEQQLLIDWSQTSKLSPEAENVCYLIEKSAIENPNRPAVVFEEVSLTYKEMMDQSAAIAHALNANGAKTNQVIGLYIDRSIEMILGMMGILRAGGAYLPIDPEYPTDRIDFILNDAEVSMIITSKNLQPQFPESKATIFAIEDLIIHGDQIKLKRLEPLHRDQLAYMIYTSGSTGKPKGVPISHENLMYSTSARFDFYPEPLNAFLLLSSFAFDSSIVGIFWTLCTGGTIVLPKKRIEQDVVELSRIFSIQRISHTLLLPSLYGTLLEYLDQQALDELKVVIVAGEACSPGLVKTHFNKLPQVSLYNEYGPTEATVWSTAYKISKEDAKGSIPIGRPIPGAENYILDQNMQLVPVGVDGELYIGGKGLANGYWNRPELTAEKFVKHPFSNNSEQRLYKTGDLVVYRSDGRIDFLGRKDHQIKIRGHRVELEEIEAILESHSLVTSAIALVKPILKDDKRSNANVTNKNKQLIAYVLGEKSLDISALRNSLKSRLPIYMIPSSIIKLDEFPRLPNGKINVRALPEPQFYFHNNGLNYIAARNPVELLLVSIWEDVLGTKPIGIYDNFFEIGGDSILSIQITSKIRGAGYAIEANQIFSQQTIAELAKNISIEQQEKKKRVEPEKGNYKIPLTYMQQAFLFNSMQKDKDIGVLPLKFELKGDLDFDLFKKAWAYVVKQHGILRTSIHYEKSGSAFQKVEPTSKLPWHFEDWQELSEDEQLSKLSNLERQNRTRSLDLTKAPVSRLDLIQLKEKDWILIWTVHHLFIDGWSGGIILKDALTYYQTLQEGASISFQPLPSFGSFVRWQQSKDRSDARQFWKKYLEGFTSPALFESSLGSTNNNQPFLDYSFKLNEEKSADLRKNVRARRLTLPIVLQGIWGILLCRYFQKQDVIFGNTVSGRFSGFEHLERMSGLFMNVLPLRIRLDMSQSISDWFIELQNLQSEMLRYDQVNQGQIISWAEQSPHLDLFNCLFVFGNFLKDGLKIGSLEVAGFEGDFSSTHPLTLRINPLQEISFDLRFDSDRLSSTEIVWFADNYKLLLEQINSDFEQNIETLFQRVPIIKKKKISSKIQVIKKSVEEYIPPRNNTELEVAKIWEKVFGRSSISMTDNFFEIGGKSIMAIQLFSKIEEIMGYNLSPVTLVEYPTIESLAGLLVSNNSNLESEWSPLVALNSNGSRLPLFCIHAGGAHVLFYKFLADELEPDRPVYAIQAKGLNGLESPFTSIENMAATYIEELQKIQPEGPYALLSTCFGNSVTLEMAHQFKSLGAEIALLAIVDSAPAHLFSSNNIGEKMPLRNLATLLKKNDWHYIFKKLKRRVIKLKQKFQNKFKTKQELHLQETIHHLNDLYNRYDWKPIDEKVTLIRSEEFNSWDAKDFHVTQWEALTKENLNLEVIPGKHIELFESPEVKALADVIKKKLSVKDNVI